MKMLRVALTPARLWWHAQGRTFARSTSRDGQSLTLLGASNSFRQTAEKHLRLVNFSENWFVSWPNSKRRFADFVKFAFYFCFYFALLSNRSFCLIEMTVEKARLSLNRFNWELMNYFQQLINFARLCNDSLFVLVSFEIMQKASHYVHFVLNCISPEDQAVLVLVLVWWVLA